MIKFNMNTSDVEVKENGTLKTNTYSEDVVQRILFKLKLDKGDWFADKNIGIPWTSEIFKIKNKINQEQKIKSYVKKELENDKDVIEVLSIDIITDEVKRKFNLKFSAKIKTGDTINGYLGKEVIT
ncbi:MAG: hypothetical protein ACRCTZ_01830 [Sarcina sp.]